MAKYDSSDVHMRTSSDLAVTASSHARHAGHQAIAPASAASHHASPPADFPLLNMAARPAFGVGVSLDSEVGAATATLYRRMRALENEGRVYNPAAKYIKCRRMLVDWICEAGEDYKLNNSTMHVAVGYMDKFLQAMDVHKSRYQLVAMACLVIAAKYEEAEEHVPSTETVNGYASHAYPPKMVHQMEVLVLTRLDWSLTCITPLHYLGIFHSRGVLFETDTIAYKSLVQKVLKYMKKYTDFFAEMCLQEYTFQQYAPSLLAAAVVMAARRALVIRPLTHAALEESLGYPAAAIDPVLAHVWHYYGANFSSDMQAQQRQGELADREAAAAAVVAPCSPTSTANIMSHAAMRALSPTPISSPVAACVPASVSASSLPPTPATAAASSTSASATARRQHWGGAWSAQDVANVTPAVSATSTASAMTVAHPQARAHVPTPDSTLSVASAGAMVSPDCGAAAAAAPATGTRATAGYVAVTDERSHGAVGAAPPEALASAAYLTGHEIKNLREEPAAAAPAPAASTSSGSVMVTRSSTRT